MIKVIIAGSRTFDDYDLLFEKCSQILEDYDSVAVEIVSGNARGADRLGERFAKEKGFALTLFPADWNKFGKSAGYIRNKEMAEYADILIVFWDGVSKGTEHMIDLAGKYNLKITKILIDNKNNNQFNKFV
jgi:hypothetical protein